MTDQERKILLKHIGERKKKALKSKRNALKLLVELGVLTPKGNLRSPYNAVCIPEEAAS